MLSQTLSLVDCLKLCIYTIRSVINRLKRQNSLTIIFMKNFLVDQTITLILISQTIKYLISILIEKECINISPILIFKNCSESLAYPLSLILKVSYNTGSLPKEWKLTNVVPIHKKGGKDDIKNYRPISLTCLVMKLFERILKEELLLRTSHLLDSRQHGFLNLKSC